jgi:hypothetical protein
MTLINYIKIRFIFFVIGFISGAIALTVYQDGKPDPKVTIEQASKPVNTWTNDPEKADYETLKNWANTPISLSYTVGDPRANITPLFVTATDTNKSTFQTWNIRTERQAVKHWGASIMFSPRGNMYGMGTYNEEMFFISAGACVPFKSMTTFDRYDVFGGVGVWIK